MENLEKLKNIKAVVFDGDGVIFPGTVFINSEGEALKQRSHVDGQGISLLRAIGIKIAFVSAEKTGFVETIGKKINNLASVKAGKWPEVAVFTGSLGKGKVEVLEEWFKKNNITWEECAVMGDDLGDYAMLSKAGFAVVPSQGEEFVKKIADYVTERKGGDGAIRDFCNLILKVRNVDPTTLDLN